MVVLGWGAVSDERGTPEVPQSELSTVTTYLHSPHALYFLKNLGFLASRERNDFGPTKSEQGLLLQSSTGVPRS